MTLAALGEEYGPQKSVPTSKCSIEKQIDILKAVVVFFDKNKIPASYKEIAPLASADATNVSSTLGFWKDIGILLSDGRKYQPSKPLIDLVRQLEWGDNESAWRSFRQAISTTWFVSHLVMSFQIKKQMTSDELITSLGKASGITSRDKQTDASLRNLVNLIEMVAILTKDSKDNYSLNVELGTPRQQILNIDEQKSLVQVRIGDEIYAVEADRLKEFVKNTGKTMDPGQQRIV